MLEDVMDDEKELKDFNLSSRVLREERRRLRERGRLERELERERSAAGTSTQSADRDSTDDFAEPSNSGNGSGVGESSRASRGGPAPSSSRDSADSAVFGAVKKRRRGRTVRDSSSSNGNGAGMSLGGKLPGLPFGEAAANDRGRRGGDQRGDLAAGKPAGAVGKALIGDVVRRQPHSSMSPQRPGSLQNDTDGSSGNENGASAVTETVDVSSHERASSQNGASVSGAAAQPPNTPAADEAQRQAALNAIEAKGKASGQASGTDDEEEAGSLAAWCASIGTSPAALSNVVDKAKSVWDHARLQATIHSC